MIWAKLGAVVMMLGVGLGAFGAHALKLRLETTGMTEAYKTAVQYHLVHGLALFAVSWLFSIHGNSRLLYAGFLFLTGIILFSGSLYLLAVTGIRPLGIITPFGGLALIAAWAMLLWSLS